MAKSSTRNPTLRRAIELDAAMALKRQCALALSVDDPAHATREFAQLRVMARGLLRAARTSDKAAQLVVQLLCK